MGKEIDMQNKSNDDLIYELRGRFINLKYNHDVKKMKVLQADCEEYFNNYEDNGHNHILNTIHALKALIDYNINDNRESAYKNILPMLENFEFGKKEGLFESPYNRYLLVYSIMLFKNYQQADELLTVIEKSFETYPIEEDLKIESLSWAYINFIEILLHSKLCSRTTDREVEEIKILFWRKIDIAREIILKENRQDLLAILTIKEAQFHLSEFSPRDSKYLTEMRKNLIQQEFEFWENIDDYPDIFDTIKSMYSKKD